VQSIGQIGIDYAFEKKSDTEGKYL